MILQNFIFNNLQIPSFMIKKIGVHDGRFHLDDVTSCVMLQLTREYCKSEIFRTRDDLLLDTFDIVVDVGRIYDHSKKRYDHHQRGFNTKWEGSNVVLSSCGLILYHYGDEVIQTLASGYDKTFSPEELAEFKNRWYFFYFECIDAEDNGTPPASTEQYSEMMTLRSRVLMLNNGSKFKSACNIVKLELMRSFYRMLLSWWPTVQKYRARPFTEECFVSEEGDDDWMALMDCAIKDKRTKMVVKRVGNEYIARPVNDLGRGWCFKWPEVWRGLYGKRLTEAAGDGLLFCDKTGGQLVAESTSALIQAYKSISK